MLDPCSLFKLFITTSLLALVVNGQETNVSDTRRGKLFSLFNIVTFPQASCTLSSDNSMKGTCMANSECSSKSGSSDGSCAAGFGVCCSFIVNGCRGTVSQNCSYIQNSEFPATSTAGQECTFTFNRICDNLCQIRLDFDNLVLSQPPSTGAMLHGDCATSGDFLTVTSPSGLSPPVTCGTLTGQHMFLETGATGTAGTAKFDIGAAVGTRTYKVKVTYYQCDSLNRAPTDCVQYFTGVSGSFQSFNYQGGQFIDSQRYTTCFRQEKGYCKMQYSEASSTTTPAFDFYIAADYAVPVAIRVAQNAGTACPASLHIPSATTTSGVHCGGVLSPFTGDTVPGAVTSEIAPFQITTIILDMVGDGEAGPLAGYNLEFTQIPC